MRKYSLPLPLFSALGRHTATLPFSLVQSLLSVQTSRVTPRRGRNLEAGKLAVESAAAYGTLTVETPNYTHGSPFRIRPNLRWETTARPSLTQKNDLVSFQSRSSWRRPEKSSSRDGRIRHRFVERLLLLFPFFSFTAFHSLITPIEARESRKENYSL